MSVDLLLVYSKLILTNFPPFRIEFEVAVDRGWTMGHWENVLASTYCIRSPFLIDSGQAPASDLTWALNDEVLCSLLSLCSRPNEDAVYLHQPLLRFVIYLLVYTFTNLRDHLVLAYKTHQAFSLSSYAMK